MNLSKSNVVSLNAMQNLLIAQAERTAKRDENTTQRMQLSFLSSELCHGETIDAAILDENLCFDSLIEAVINDVERFDAALKAITKNDLLPMQELMQDNAKKLVKMAKGWE